MYRTGRQCASGRKQALGHPTKVSYPRKNEISQTLLLHISTKIALLQASPTLIMYLPKKLQMWLALQSNLWRSTFLQSVTCDLQQRTRRSNQKRAQNHSVWKVLETLKVSFQELEWKFPRKEQLWWKQSITLWIQSKTSRVFKLVQWTILLKKKIENYFLSFMAVTKI